MQYGLVSRVIAANIAYISVPYEPLICGSPPQHRPAAKSRRIGRERLWCTRAIAGSPVIVVARRRQIALHDSLEPYQRPGNFVHVSTATDMSVMAIPTLSNARSFGDIMHICEQCQEDSPIDIRRTTANVTDGRGIN